MNSEKLNFDHKDLLYDRLRRIACPIAEYSFANVYLFRETHAYELLRDKEIFIRGRSYDGFAYLMPTVDVRGLELDYLRELLVDVDFLFPIPESWIGIFPPDEFNFSALEGDMDYVYEVEKMSTYRGRRLHNKRNLLKHFVTGYKHEAHPLTDKFIGDAKFILEEWQSEAGSDSAGTDYGPCLEALNLYEQLILCGGIYYADAEPAGFIIGEELNDETFVLHFAKARTKFKGVYQYMFNNFSKILPVKYRYLNLEQDLDNEALRVAKSSYQPDARIRKVRVSRKGD